MSKTPDPRATGTEERLLSRLQATATITQILERSQILIEFLLVSPANSALQSLNVIDEMVQQHRAESLLCAGLPA